MRSIAISRRILVVVVFALALSLAGAASAATRPVDATNQWSASTPAAQGMDAKVLAQADSYARTKLPLTSLLVVRHGRLVLERYYHGGSRRTHTHVQSVTKSVISALVGIALARGELTSLDQKLVDFLPESAVTAATDPRVAAITLRQLLTMSGGWAGDVRTNYGYRAEPSWVTALVNRPLEHEPGTVFDYDSGTAHLVSAVLTKATGMPADEYAARYLFAPLGIGGDALWQRDPGGNSLGGWGLSLTARQMAKLGYLYLRKGKWGGTQIVPAAWIAASTSTQILTGADSSSSRYGYFWWLRPQPTPARFAASGLGGQYILVWPGLDLVVVITASGTAQWSLDPLVDTYVLPAVRK